MTESVSQKKSGVFPISGSRLSLSVFGLTALLFLLFPVPVSRGAASGLHLCAHSVIPALFPFFCLTPFLVILSRRITFLPPLVFVFLIGMTAGSPLGAVMLASFYETGALDRDTAERALGVVTGASPSFLFGYAGAALGGSVSVGILYFAAQLLSSVLLFLLFLGRRGFGKSRITFRKDVPTFSSAIADAAVKMLNVCGIIVFFSALRGLLGSLCSALSLSPVFSALLCGYMEMTGGLADLSSVLPFTICIPFSGALIGMGGLAVFMQVSSAAKEKGLSVRYYLPEKLLCGFLCFLFCRLFADFL